LGVAEDAGKFRRDLVTPQCERGEQVKNLNRKIDALRIETSRRFTSIESTLGASASDRPETG
jgi:hypothetical protein